jgi:hypothetical protein
MDWLDTNSDDDGAYPATLMLSSGSHPNLQENSKAFAVKVACAAVNETLFVTEPYPSSDTTAKTFERYAVEFLKETQSTSRFAESFCHTWSTARHICLAHASATVALMVVVSSMKCMPAVSPRLTLLQLRFASCVTYIPNRVRTGLEGLLFSWLGHHTQAYTRRLVIQLHGDRRPGPPPASLITNYLEMLACIFTKQLRGAPAAQRVFVIISVPDEATAEVAHDVLQMYVACLSGHWYIAIDPTGCLPVVSLGPHLVALAGGAATTTAK